MFSKDNLFDFDKVEFKGNYNGAASRKSEIWLTKNSESYCRVNISADICKLFNLRPDDRIDFYASKDNKAFAFKKNPVGIFTIRSLGGKRTGIDQTLGFTSTQLCNELQARNISGFGKPATHFTAMVFGDNLVFMPMEGR